MYSLINKQECSTSFKIRDAADNPMDKDQRMMIDRSLVWREVLQEFLGEMSRWDTRILGV